MLATTCLSFLLSLPQTPNPELARLHASNPNEQKAAAAALEALGPSALPMLRSSRDEAPDEAHRSRLEHVIAGIELAHPGGLMLAFTRGEARATELRLWQDGVETVLTADQSMELEPALSPDGLQLAYARTADHHDYGAHPIFVRTLATGRERELARGRCPVWSPDGNLLAVIRDGGVTLHDLTNATERRLGGELDQPSSLQWSTDGRFLAVECGKEIVVADVAADRVHARIAGTPPGTSTLASFSFGGDRLALVSGNGPYDWDVFLVQLADGAPRKLTAQSFRHGITALSPDGRLLLSTQSKPWQAAEGELVDGPREPTGGRGDYAAYLLDTRDGSQRLVFDGAEPLLRPSWSPEGRFVVFVDAQQRLQLLHARTGRSRALTSMQVGYGPVGVWFAPSVWFANGRAMPKAVGAAR